MSVLQTHTDLFGKQYFQAIQALSWKQPFGSLMLHGKIETRTWKTEHRGKVLLCLSDKPYKDNEVLEMVTSQQWDQINQLLLNEPTKELIGHAFAVGVLVECRQMWPEDETPAFVKYNPHLYSHIYKDVRRIEPFKFKGAQKWKNVADQETLSKIKYL